MAVESVEQQQPAERRLDATTFAVLFSAFESIVDEMSLTFERSAWSSIIAQCRDFSCAVFDAGSPPNALCAFEGMPVHVHAQPVCLQSIVEFFGDEIGDGDVIILNSPYFGTTHIGDLVAATPVFWEGEHVFWAVATGHQMDVGSAYNTSVPVHATDVWKEGLQITPLKLEEGGRVRRDVLELYLQNVRHRDFLYGDLMSQIGSVKAGRRRMLELLERWDRVTLQQFAADAIDYADRRTAAQIAAMPDGVYRSETWVDSDAMGMRNIHIACELAIEGSEVRVDFSGSDPQTRAGINASWTTCVSSGLTPVLACLDHDIPHNQGCLRHFTVHAEPGTIALAEWPASTGDATIVPGDALGDVVWRCLAQALPAKAVAGSSRISPNALATGYDRRVPGVEIPFGVILFNCSGGGGASADFDGSRLVYCVGALGGMKILPIELIELHFPIVVSRHEIRTDSMGAGRTRGGPGLHFEAQVRGTGQVDFYGYGDGLLNPPFGVFGGTPGDGGEIYRRNADGSRSFFSAMSYIRINEGETWVAASSGGGGYGDPFERDAELVAADVRDGYVSRAAAGELYGVHLGDDGAVDAEATTRARAQARELAHLTPTGPDASGYPARVLAPGDRFEFDALPPLEADFTL